jgi:hypothetical protein
VCWHEFGAIVRQSNSLVCLKGMSSLVQPAMITPVQKINRTNNNVSSIDNTNLDTFLTLSTSKQQQQQRGSPPADSRAQWSGLGSIIKNRRRNSFLGQQYQDKNVQSLDINTLEEEVHNETIKQTKMLQEQCNLPKYREKVLKFLFRHFATWSPGENTPYISRTSWRQACREMNFKSKRFIHGDIEVVFADAFLTSKDMTEEEEIGASTSWQEEGLPVMDLSVIAKDKKRTAKKSKPLLNYRQFVMALQLVAIKRYGASQYQHLDPRYVVLANNSKIRQFVEPFHQLYHKKLLTSAVRFGFLEDEERNRNQHGGLSKSPRMIASSATGSVSSPVQSSGQSGSTPPTLSDMERRVNAAVRVIRVDTKALKGLFNVYALSDLSNGTGTFADSGMSFDEFASFGRDCEIVPQFCSLTDLIVVFRENRVLHQGDFNLEYSGSSTECVAHMLLSGFIRALATVAVKFVRRDSKALHTKMDRTHHLTAESSREKVMALLKTIANSRGVRAMALRPRRYAHVRFVSRMNGFK